MKYESHHVLCYKLFDIIIRTERNRNLVQI